ncbi:MAG: lysophospholipid acyltransferase family protein [Flavobacteriaceae bacterium]|nr:lysophospholipid acyltransferase family protein [Flavobacteriaceae bacterium]
MGLVTSKELAKAINLDKFGFIGTFIGWVLMKILKIDRLNKVYNKSKHLKDVAFLTSLLNDLEIKYEIPEEDLKRIPKEGAFVTVSNHPLGGIDGALLLKIILEQRKDFKIIANFLLHRIAPMKSYMMPVNPFEGRKDIKSSLGGFKRAIFHLRSGAPLGIFPAGEVSTKKEDDLAVDKQWEPAAMKLIQKAQVPILPIYFHAKNSSLFYQLSNLSDTLRSARLPSEVLSQKNRVVKIRIGKPILVKDQKEHSDLKDFTEFIRKKTYMLANPYEKDSISLKDVATSTIKKTMSPASVPKKIVTSVSAELIEQEVENLRGYDCRLLESKNYEVFLVSADKIPNILKELGRLREITFREIGEGTNKAIDLDSCDSYYHHLFLWDNTAKKIAGAYRMGLGSKIFAKYGIDGFYLHDLFRFEPELYGMMSESIEMGRAFIIKEYQQKPMPLFLLWRGVMHTTLRFPEHKYLIGGVSISNKFSSFSKSLMIEFMKSHYYDPYVAQYIRPKKEFKVKLKDADKDFVFDETKADLNKFDRVIDELEPGLRIPVLLKKYIKQNAKVIAFNVDPLFNDAVDGLMYIKIADIPESTMRPVMEEFQSELERKTEGNEK